MSPPPAEHCCCACPLLQGVQIIASYTVVVGTYNLLSLLMRGPADEPAQSESLQVVSFLETVYHTLAFFAGLKGLIGIMFRDSRRLRVLFLYNIGDLLVKSVTLIFREAEACDELRKRHSLHPTAVPMNCETARVLVMTEYVIHTALFAYFVYVIWSLITRLESGELGLRRGMDMDQELADRAVLVDPWLFIGAGDASNSLMSRAPLVPGAPQAGAGERGAAAGRGGGVPRPFSGAPRNLDERGQQPASSEPFQGTAHRLE